MKHISSIDKNVARGLSFLASDLDGTLLVGLEFVDPVIEALNRWTDSGRGVIFLTGRPARWVLDKLSGRFFIDLMLAENGGVIFKDGEELIQTEDKNPRVRLDEFFRQVQKKIPEARKTGCDKLRKTDLTINIREGVEKDLLSSSQVSIIHEMARASGLQSTESHIHIHIFTEEKANKGQIASHLFSDFLGIKDYKKRVLVMGDSLNDEPMFNPRYFPISCGVANIKNYLPRMTYRPSYITKKEQGWGVIEVIDFLLGLT